jgi:hypothetical protein
MGKRYETGVNFFTCANLDMNVFFPEDEVKCKWCRFLQHNDGLDRDKCGLTNEILVSREIIGIHCPLTIMNEVKVEDMKK